MSAIRVAVLRGGPSSEYDVSLNTGANVLRALGSALLTTGAPKYKTKDVLISKDGRWFMDGLAVTPERVCRGADAVFNAMHGEFGEDGQVQRILDKFKVAYTGSGAWPSAVAMNKALAKDYFKKNGIRTPHGIVVRGSSSGTSFVRSLTEGGFAPNEIPELPDENYDALANKIFSKISPPWFVKPNTGGSSVGASLCRNLDELSRGLETALKWSDSALVEECIRGREATCGVIDNFRGAKNYALFPIEIIKPKSRDFFDYQCKYDGTTREICPGNFSADEKREIQELAVKIHRALGLRHYSRSDFIVTQRGVYALEVNTLPGLTSESLFPKAMAAVGCSYSGFLDHLLGLALGR